MIAQYLGFVAIAVILVITPGPDFAVVLRSAFRGRRYGVMTSLGTAAGLTIHSLAAALGLSALLLASAELFTFVKIAGALFLTYLGVKALLGARKTKHTRTESTALPAGALPTPWIAFRQGLTINVLNPKAPLIFLSIMPSFITRGQPVLAQTLVMSATLVLIALVWYALLSLTVDRFKSIVDRSKRRIDQISGVVFIGLGIRHALEQHPAT
ncbi:MAG: LysE family translocator, partial [Lacisediminihabitans sp.]